MTWLSDAVVARLRSVAGDPDLTGTRYRLQEPLASGGMGTVYRVEDTALERSVALKVLHTPDPSGQLAARLMREARILAHLEHPGIVPVHDVGSLPDGRVFYTMKLVQGKRLDQQMEDVSAIPDRLRVFQRICEGVAFAHAHGVLHRDLKPANVMVGPFGEVLVMDWGVAKVLREISREPVTMDGQFPSDAADTAHGAVLGTPGYMAPEQARGETTTLDQRADVYSLGAILRFLLSSVPAAGATTTESPSSEVDRSGMRDLPRPLAAIAAQAMAAEREQRYGSVQELATDVAHYLDGLPVSAYPEGPLAKAWRWTSRNRAWVLLILAYLVMRAALFLWSRR